MPLDETPAPTPSVPPTPAPATVSAVRDSLLASAREVFGPDPAPWTVVDFPSHLNCGDSAIWLGELALARSLGTRVVQALDRSTWGRVAARDDTTLVLHGGGNFGGLYPTHENLRLAVLRSQKGRRVVQMPQSIEYRDEESRDAIRRAVADHGDVLMLVRDLRSLAIAERDLDCEVRLVPDAAFALGALRRGPARQPVAVQRRVDREAGAAQLRADLPTFDWLEAPRYSRRALALRATKLAFRVGGRLPRLGALGLERLPAGVLARANLDGAARMLSAGELLLTDRLHGHVLATLLGVEHIVVNDKFGKIEALWGTWTHALPGSRFAADWSTAFTLLDAAGPAHAAA